MITEALTQKLIDTKHLMTPQERMAFVMEQLTHEYAMRLKAEKELYQTRKWAAVWKRAAKTERDIKGIIARFTRGWHDRAVTGERFAHLWKQSAKAWRQAAHEAQRTNGVVRVPVVGQLSAETRPEDFERWGANAST